jgi:8-hydroxy-5-deazaflavin:NADPH oxidoreductase
MAGADNLDGKILVDVSNPLDFSAGMPPSLFVSNTDSLGERIQAQLPGVRVVKALNTVNASVMVDPGQLADGDHHVFLSGNDAGAKQAVADLLRDRFGWRHVLDLGDISTARGAEMLMPMWLRLMGSLGTAMFNWRIVT